MWWRPTSDSQKAGKSPEREADNGRTKSHFHLESLEPRILLSGDPILAEIARMGDPDLQQHDESAALVHTLEDLSSTEAASENQTMDNAADGAVSWPQGWERAADEADNNAARNLESSVDVTINMAQGYADEAASDNSSEDQQAGMMAAANSELATANSTITAAQNAAMSDVTLSETGSFSIVKSMADSLDQATGNDRSGVLNAADLAQVEQQKAGAESAQTPFPDQADDGLSALNDLNERSVAMPNNSHSEATSSASMSAESDLDLSIDYSDASQQTDSVDDLAAGIFAAAHRTQNNQRSARYEGLVGTANRSDSGHARVQAKLGAGTNQTAISENIDDDSLARAPPVIQQDQSISDFEVTDRDHQGVSAAVFAEVQTALSTAYNDTFARGPPADDAQPRAPPVASDNPEIILTNATAGDVGHDAQNSDPQIAAPSDPDSQTPAQTESSSTQIPDSNFAVDVVPLSIAGDHLTADGTPPGTPDGTVFAIATDLTADALVTEAILRWTNSGLLPFGAIDLSTITVVVADLGTDILASFSGSTITIDDDAAGFGWFIDLSPGTNTEFEGATPTGIGIDLLTTLIHEFGHALGFAHPGEAGLPGVEAMASSLSEGVRLLPQMADGTRLDDVFDVILATFDSGASQLGLTYVFTSADDIVPDVATVGAAPVAAGGGVDLQLEGLTLTFSELVYTAGEWAGEVLVLSDVAILLPNGPDIVVVDDAMTSATHIQSVTSVITGGVGISTTVDVWGLGLPINMHTIDVPDGTYLVDFTVSSLGGDLNVGDELLVRQSNGAGFSDTDTGDGNTITVAGFYYDPVSGTHHVLASYNFDPGTAASWTSGVLALDDTDAEDDGDANAVSGTIQLADGENSSVLGFDQINVAQIWPTLSWLVSEIEVLQLEFTDFRVDDSNSALRMDTRFVGIDTGNDATNAALAAALLIEGSSSVVFNMDKLAEGVADVELSVLYLPPVLNLGNDLTGSVSYARSAIDDISGISGGVSLNIPSVLSISAGFIYKEVGLNDMGVVTNDTNLVVRTITYLAVRGTIEVGGKPQEGPVLPGQPPLPDVGGYSFGVNFAISELGPLQFFLYSNAGILLEPVSGLQISQLRGGIRFSATLEGLQIRDPLLVNTTDGVNGAIASGDIVNPVEITLTLPEDHTLKAGDEFRITEADDMDFESGVDNFVVTSVNGDVITYLTTGNVGDYTFSGEIKVKKISISDPFDLRDPGFASTASLSLADWEAQLDAQVAIQSNAINIWDALFGKFVIEAGATLDFDPRISSSILEFKVDLLLGVQLTGNDLGLQLLLNGTMVLGSTLNLSAKVYADLSNLGNGTASMLFLAELPEEIAGIEPIVVIYAGVTFETLINGLPATLDALTGLPPGIGTDISAATITDLSGGNGPWEVTLTLNSNMVDNEYSTGDTIVVVGSEPDTFSGTYLVTAVTSTTVSFVIGSTIIDGQVDVNRDGVISALDDGTLGSIVVIDGLLDINGDETVDATDNGEIFNVAIINGIRQVVAYVVLRGYVDVNGDTVVDGDTGDDVVIGEDPRLWASGFDLTRDIIDGAVDFDDDGDIDADDGGNLGGLGVYDGLLDFNSDGMVDAEDDGTLLNVVIDSAGNRTVTSYTIIDGYLDIDGDTILETNGDDSLTLNLADLGGYWMRSGYKAANQDDLGDGFRITITGGIDLNIPLVTTLSLSGTAMLDVTFGGVSDVRMDFDFDMSLSETNVGTIAQAAGQFVIIMDSNDGLDIWGAAVLTTDFSFLEEVGLFATASGLLIINNTDVDQAPITLPVTNGTVDVVPTANSFVLRVEGMLDFKIDGTQVFRLDGIFVLSFIAGDGFNVALFSENDTTGAVEPATMSIGPVGAPYLQLTAFGFMGIRFGDDAGIAANIILGLDGALPGDFATVTGTLVFMINTTGKDITFDIPPGVDDRGNGSVFSVTIPGVAPPSLAAVSVPGLIQGDGWDPGPNPVVGPYVMILVGGPDLANPNASLGLFGGTLTLEGRFGLLMSVDTVSSEFVFELQVNASLTIDPLGSLTASGFLRITDAGVVGSLQIGGTLSLGPLSIVGAFTLEVNTTNTQQDVQRYLFDFDTETFQDDNNDGVPDVVSTPVAANTVALFAFAKIKIAGSFELSGSISFLNNPDLLALTVNMNMEFFGTTLRVNGLANVIKTGDSPGLVLKLTAAIDVNFFGVSGIFDFSADLELQINTRDNDAPVDANDAGITRGSFRIDVSDASLSLLSVVTLTGSGYIEFSNGVFGMQVSLMGDFLSVVTVQATAFFSSEGEFYLSLNGSIQLGPDCFNIHGSAGLTVSRLDDNGQAPGGDLDMTLAISGTLVVGAELFCISIDFTVGVAYNSDTGDITIRIGPVPVPGIGWTTVDLGWFGEVDIPYPTITLEYQTFTIGTLIEGPTPPPPVLAQVDANGVMTVNAGSLANRTLRNLVVGEIHEGVILEELGDGTLAGTKRIKVTMFGVSQTYDNVTEILIADMADGNDFVQIDASVTTKVTVNLGDDADTLISEGTGVVIAHGGRGNDNLTGGSANDQLFGGDDQDTIRGGLGTDLIDGGNNSDRIVWQVGDGSDTPINGQAGTDTLIVRGTSAVEQMTVSANGSGFIMTIGTETLSVAGVEIADIEAGGGADLITINDLTASSLNIINLQLGNDTAADAVTINGSNSAEVFDVSAITAVTQVVTGGEVILDIDGNFESLTPIVVTPTNVSVLDVTKTNAITVNIFGATPSSGGDTVALNTLDGDDTINVLGTMAGLATTVSGGNQSDTINVGNNAAGTLINPNINSGGDLSGIAAALTVHGNAPSFGSDVLNIDDSTDATGDDATLTFNSITGLTAVGIFYTGFEQLNIALGSGADTFMIASTHAKETNLNANNGSDVINVRAIAGVTTINSGPDADTINVGSNTNGTLGIPNSTASGNLNSIDALLTINGSGTTGDVLNVDDTLDGVSNTGVLTNTRLTGLGMGNTDQTVVEALLGITYTGFEQLNIALGSGADTFTITGTYTEETNLNANNGADVINVRSIAGVTTINSGADADTINVGSNTNGTLGIPNSTASGNLNSIDALLTINGSGTTGDVLNVDDTLDGVSNTGVLTNTRLTGLGMGNTDQTVVEALLGITYTGFEQLNIALGSGADTFTITGTYTEETNLNANNGADVINVRSIAGVTTINSGADADTINVGSNTNGTLGIPNSTASGNLNSIDALLTINGSGTTGDVLNVDDTLDGVSNTGVLTNTRLTGLGMGNTDQTVVEALLGITYTGFEQLNIALGSGADTFTIISTHTEETNLNANNGADVINVRTIAGVTTINSGADADTINVGSNADATPGNPNTFTSGDLNSIDALLTINGNGATSGSDVLNVDDTLDGAANTGVLTNTRLTGLGMGNTDQTEVEALLGITYSGFEILLVSLGSGANLFTINSTHNSATSPDREQTTLNTGAGIDTVDINGVSDVLFVNGQADADTINVNNTSVGSTATLNGDGGNDIFNIRAMDGDVNVNGGANIDTVNVGTDAPTLPSNPTSLEGTIDAINGLLDVNGGADAIDVLNIDDSDPANDAKAGTLTSSTLRGLELERGINYSNFEELNIWLGTGNNVFTINGTHDGATTLNTAQGQDRIDINSASGLLTVNSEADSDTVNVRNTELNSEVRINTAQGADVINISDTSPTLPGLYPATLPPPAADSIGVVDNISGLLVINGGSDFDVINIDDSGNATAKYATLTVDTLRGLALPAGVNYTNAEDFNLWLGTGEDVLFIGSTHTGTTQIYAGDGNAITNQRDDTIAISTISGVTTIHGQAGNDFIEVNVNAPVLPQDESAATFASLAPITGFFERTHLNGLDAVLNLHGEGDSDQYTLNFAGSGNALVNVHDNGAPDNGVDTLIVNGADIAAGITNQPNDTILLRNDFLALLNESGGVDTGFDQFERANYDENINARLIVNGLGGNDAMFVDNTSAVLTLDGGNGNDTFQVGQVFGTPRDADANIVADDQFDTTAVIIGVIRDAAGDIIFNPAEDVLDGDAIIAIHAAIQAANGALSGIAYVSDGVNQATTIFGGAGEDKFSVYHNVGTLRLEGEADNDSFVVRAFVTLPPLDPALANAQQADTEVNGGDGDDSIQYAINAPVSVDGGAGFDSIVVLGTPFPDHFVVASFGIFGAGLNVRFENVESAELDTLEGDDVVYILSTSADLITTVIGGLGDDRFEVLGDVVSQIISNDLLGRSGLITHGFSSLDGFYNAAGVNGVVANVISAADGSLVDISQSGEPLLVSEDGQTAQYDIMLTAPLADLFETVYITVSAGVVSTLDQSLNGASILVSLDNVTFTNAVVLTFNAAGIKQTIYVRAIDDAGFEGERLALISHSINSAHGSYDDLPLRDVLVTIVDNDLPGVDIRQFEDLIPDNVTEVLEGADGFTDVYQFALTTAPEVGETVTVTLTLPVDAQVTLSQTVFVFDHTNWDDLRSVIVTAIDDAIQDGVRIIRITHEMTSTDINSQFNQAPELYQTLDVTVFDDESAGAVIRQSDGNTVVILNPLGAVASDDDSYRVRLTSTPTSTVTLRLYTDTQTQLFSSDPRFQVVSETGGQFEYTVTFDASNWNDWFEIGVTANADFVGGSTTVKVFAPEDQNLDRLQGALILEGGIIEGLDRSLAVAVVMPGEANFAVGQESPVGDDIPEIDVLNIYHTDNNDADTGALVYRDAGTLIANTGYALTGFGMGGTQVMNEGTPQVPVYVTYGGGITYGSFEIIELLLGKGNETLNILATADGAITAVHGGGGNDTINVFDRGNGPLILYGDTSEDRLRYANSAGGVSSSGTSFNNDGNDTINAAAMAEQSDGFVGLVIYGGAGTDTITGSQDDDHIAGGSGMDTIHGESGVDHIYGDSQFNVDLMLFAMDQQVRFDAVTDLAQINAMFTVVTTGTGDADTINGGGGNDIIFGDHGVIGQTDGTRRLESTGDVILVETTNLANGGNDTIHGDGGNEFIFGGTASDTIFGDLGSDLIFGDFGSVVGDINALMIGEVDGAGVQNPNAVFTYTSDISAAADGSAGNDTLYGGSLAILDTDTGNNILLGQQGSDTIFGGGSDDDIYGGHNVENGTDTGDYIDGAAGNDVIVGDNGLIERTAVALDPRFAALQGTLIYDNNGVALIDSTVNGANPVGTEARLIELFNHSDSSLAIHYGNDIIAGGADEDVIFGQLGNDVMHGDGRLNISTVLSLTATIANSDVGGDDYIEGNGGGDTIYGGLGQDDIIGGSSSLYSLTTPDLRPDGSDTIFGGNGDLILRNDFGTAIVDEAGNLITNEDTRHARDADMILGDNGNIFRLVGTSGIDSGNFLTFAYDNYDAALPIVVRAAQLLDYTPGGADFNAASAATDIGAADTIHGESGDDAIYAQVGNDIVYGDAQDDDIIGGYGHDWISGGTGDDGVLGDDGRIYTSRNSETIAETLYGLGTVVFEQISTPGGVQSADINIAGELIKTVNLTPFNVDGGAGFQNPLYNPQFADDVIYGGLGNDFLHGGSGDDAMSGAEALQQYYDAPFNPGNLLRFNEVRAGEFAAYDEYNPLSHILVDANGEFTTADDPTAVEFLLNFLANDPASAGVAPVNVQADGTMIYSDGNDRLFGDLGNDWLVGGTGNDNLYGGRGDDLLNADDDHETTSDSADPRANNEPDTDASYEDLAYGGAGRDILIANTGGDRLIDWAGEFNSYLVPFAPFGNFTISRTVQPQLMEFLYDLSAADGADPTRAADTGASAQRNGEPEGELGVVTQQDPDWQNQTGAPDDPQPGNIPGGPRDVLRGADFNNGNGNNGDNGNNGNGNASYGFAADRGSWVIVDGRLQIAPEFIEGDALSVFYVDDILPSYFEMIAIINGGKPTGGYKSNAYFIFDYQSPTDFKFAGINISTDKLQMGHYSVTEGWVIDVQTPSQLTPDTDYTVLLSINGLVATLLVNNVEVFSFAYQPRVDIYGVSHGLNGGMVGLGGNNSIARIDNVYVQVLPPDITLEQTETFEDGVADWFNVSNIGNWQIQNDAYVGTPLAGDEWAQAMIDLSVGPAYLLRAQTTLNTDDAAGFIFDQYGLDSFKFVALSATADQVLIGHYTERGGWKIDASIDIVIDAGIDYDLEISLKGTTVSVFLNGQSILGHFFNALVVDGSFGLFSQGGVATFSEVTRITNDPAFLNAPDNNAPTALSDDLVATEDTALLIDTAVLLGNDVDPDGDTLSVSSFTQALYGLVMDNGDGTLTYTPTDNYNGADSFSYTTSDGNGGFSTTQVSITVTAVNDVPVAVNDQFVTNRNSPFIIDGSTLLNNDGDIDGDNLIIISMEQPQNGVIIDNGDGTYTYMPNPGFHGTDAFEYTVSDGNGGVAVATINITVRGGGIKGPRLDGEIIQLDLGALATPGGSGLSDFSYSGTLLNDAARDSGEDTLITGSIDPVDTTLETDIIFIDANLINWLADLTLINLSIEPLRFDLSPVTTTPVLHHKNFSPEKMPDLVRQVIPQDLDRLMNMSIEWKQVSVRNSLNN